MNVSEVLAIPCAIVPDRVAIVFDGQSTSYQELSRRSNCLAETLAQLGVVAGDRVATLEVNRPELLEIYFAAACLDAIYVPLSFRAKVDELTHMLDNASPAVLFVGERYLELVRPIIRFGGANTRVVPLIGQAPPGKDAYAGIMAADSLDANHFSHGDDQGTSVLMFTAGTTGIPKGVMLTHQSLTAYLLAHVTPPDPDVEESNLLCVPLYHVAGLQSALAAIYGGRKLVLMRQFEPKAWLELVQRERPTRSMLVPTMLKQVIEQPDFRSYDTPSLEVLTYGASPMPLAVIKQAIEEFPGAQFINAFGQTESGATIAALGPEDHVLEGPPEEVEKRLRRLSSIGRPLQDVVIGIVDQEDREVLQGQVGELVARGARVMKGYWGQEADTQATIRGGWLHTGDLAYQDEDGYIYLAGRARDFIKRGGEMISAEEVERVLMSHFEVEEAAVIGVPDADWGERVRAIVVRKGEKVTEDELKEYCRRRLASFKKPESVVFVDELPRNPLGKVLKTDLRENFAQPIQGVT